MLRKLLTFAALLLIPLLGTTASAQVKSDHYPGTLVLNECAAQGAAEPSTVNGCNAITFNDTAATINTINTCTEGRTLHIICGASATAFGDGAGNLELNGAFTCSLNDTLSLYCDGTNWLETSRGVTAGGAESNDLEATVGSVTEDEVFVGDTGPSGTYRVLPNGAVKYDTSADVFSQAAFSDVSGSVSDAQVPDTITIATRSAADCTAETGGVTDELCVDSTAGAGTGIWRCPSPGDCVTTTAWERADDATGGAETNTLTTMGGVADMEIALGASTNVGAYLAITACAADAKPEFANDAPNTFTCEQISGLIDADVSDTLTASVFKGSGTTTDAIDLATAEVAGTLPAASVGTGLTDAQVLNDLTIAFRSAADCTAETGGVADEICLDSTAGGGAGLWRCPAGGDCNGTTAWLRVDDTSGSGAPTGAQYIVGVADGTLSAEQVATDTATIDVVLAGGDGGAATFDFLPAGVDGPTWGDNTSSIWTFAVGATDPAWAFSSDTLAITSMATLTASSTDADFDALTATTVTTDASDTGEMRLTTATGSDQVAIGITQVTGDSQMDFTVDDTTTGDDTLYFMLDGVGETVDVYEPMHVSHGTAAGEISIFEPSGAGAQSVKIIAPATMASDRTCTLEDDATPFDNCVTAGGSPPTGTGFRHVTAGAEDAASVLVTLSSATEVAANQGTTTTFLQGNAAGQASWQGITLTADVDGILPGANGGTNNGFMDFTGPTTSLKTFTLPDASSTILTDNAAVSVVQGGTGQTTYTDGQLLIGNTTGNTLAKATLAAEGGGEVTVTNGSGTITLDVGANTIDHTEIAATVTFADNDFLDMSAVVLTTVSEGIYLPGAVSDCTTATGEGQICWDRDDNSTTALWVGDGTTARNIGDGGGITDINDLGDATGVGAVTLGANQEYSQVWTWNLPTAEVANFDALTLAIEHDSTSGAFTQNGLVIERSDGAGTQTMESLLQINNNEISATVTDGIQMTSGNGTITNALNMNDAEITNAFVTPNATISMAELEYLDGGTRTDENLCTHETTGNQLDCSTAPTDDNVLVGSGATWQLKAMPTTGGSSSCHSTGEALQYNVSTNSFECITGLAAGGAHDGTITWTGASIMDHGAALSYGISDEATITHTYATSGANDPILTITDDSAAWTNVATFNVEGSQVITAADTIDALAGVTTITDGSFCQGGTANGMDCDVAIIPGADGGTNNGFMDFTGPTTSLKTFTLPDATSTILTDNADVTVAQGGTGLSVGTDGGILGFTTTTALTSSALLAASQVMIGGGAGATPTTLAAGTDNFVLRMGAANPTYEAEMLTKSVTIETPTTADDVTMFFTPLAITITQSRISVIGTGTPSWTVDIRHHTDRNNAGNALITTPTASTAAGNSATTTGHDITSFNDATIPANSFVWLETDAVTTTTVGHVTLRYTID